MARKKSSQQQKSSQEEAAVTSTTTMEDSTEKLLPSSKEVLVDKPVEMKEDPSEKLENLKSLNKLLVKETVEKRELVDSLTKSKECLEKEIGELKEENERVVMEKKMLEEEKAEEVDSLRLLVKDLEESKCEDVREIERLKIEKDAVLEEKVEIEIEAGNLKKEMDIEIKKLQRALDLLNVDIDGQRVSFEDVLNQKSEIQKALDVAVKESEDLKSTIRELELNSEEILKKNLMQAKEIEKLDLEKTQVKSKFEVLMGDIVLLQEESETKTAVITDLQIDVEKFSTAISSLQKENGKLQYKIAETENQKEELRRQHEEASKEQIKEICKLQSEIVNYRSSLENITLERDDVQNEFNLKKMDEASLKLQVQNLQKSIDEGLSKLELLRKERDSLLTEKKEMGTQNQLLIEEKLSLKKLYSEKTLLMLKNASQVICGSEDLKNWTTDAEEMEEEILPFASELGAMKRAFKIKEKKVEELNQQIETLTSSVVEAQKRKNLWTWLSSATTVFAAASVAYVAKGH